MSRGRRDDNGSGRFATMLESIAPPPDRVALDTEGVLHELINHVHQKQRRADEEIKRAKLGMWIALGSVILAVVAGIVTTGRYMERVDNLKVEVSDIKLMLQQMRAEAREDRRR